MRRRIPLLLVAVALFIAMGPALAYAQELVTANIPFKFIAAGRTHDPGEYQLRVGSDQMTWTLAPAKGAPSVATVITRLAAHEAASSGDRVVFDKIGETYYLSEIWPAAEDGYLLHTTNEHHTHHVLKLVRRAR